MASLLLLAVVVLLKLNYFFEVVLQGLREVLLHVLQRNTYFFLFPEQVGYQKHSMRFAKGVTLYVVNQLVEELLRSSQVSWLGFCNTAYSSLQILQRDKMRGESYLFTPSFCFFSAQVSSLLHFCFLQAKNSTMADRELAFSLSNSGITISSYVFAYSFLPFLSFRSLDERLEQLSMGVMMASWQILSSIQQESIQRVLQLTKQYFPAGLEDAYCSCSRLLSQLLSLKCLPIILEGIY